MHSQALLSVVMSSGGYCLWTLLLAVAGVWVFCGRAVELSSQVQPVASEFARGGSFVRSVGRASDCVSSRRQGWGHCTLLREEVYNV